LKIGRYVKTPEQTETLECSTPKSELTLDNDEFKALLNFIEENYEPFRQGVKRYLPIDQKFDPKSLAHLKAIFDNPDKNKVLDFIATHSILPDELIVGLQTQSRIKAVNEFEIMLNRNLVEQEWQAWFTKNDWVLRYKKGKSFCTLIPEKNRFTIQIVFSGEERLKMKTIRDELSAQTRKDYDEATTYHDGKWLLLTVDGDKMVDHVERLLAVKRRPKNNNRND
jgi:Protein of unknown function (DUF3788)